MGAISVSDPDGKAGGEMMASVKREFIMGVWGAKAVR